MSLRGFSAYRSASSWSGSSSAIRRAAEAVTLTNQPHDESQLRGRIAHPQSSAESTNPETSPQDVANIQAVVDLERRARRERTRVERITDLVTGAASSTGFIFFHLVWFSGWIAVNVFSPRRFDPFPFNLLTLVVSLEAIVLTGFVLMSQNRMTQLADNRARLDLQVNLLAEQELTAILQVVCLIAEKAGIAIGNDPRLVKFLSKTDVKALADELTREMATADDATASPTLDKESVVSSPSPCR
jgi:uncharacterized membrane protein